MPSDEPRPAPIDWELYSFDLHDDVLHVYEGGREIGRINPFVEGRPASALARHHCCRRAAREIIEKRGESVGVPAGSLF